LAEQAFVGTTDDIGFYATEERVLVTHEQSRESFEFTQWKTFNHRLDCLESN